MEKNQTKKILVDFIRKVLEKRNLAWSNSLYGFYVRTFGKVCDASCLADSLAEELADDATDGKTRQSFIDLIYDMSDSLYEACGLRVCSYCGKFMQEGYYINGEYACSEGCAIRLYMPLVDGDVVKASENFKSDLQYDDETEAGEVYWTSWKD